MKMNCIVCRKESFPSKESDAKDLIEYDYILSTI